MNTWILKSLYLVLFRTVWQTVEATLESLKKLHKTAKKELARARGVFWEQENQVKLTINYTSSPLTSLNFWKK